jgi:hypothetical protein
MRRWYKPLAAALLLPLILTACLFLPGKFDSTLTIHADRSFTFTYKGEVIAADLEGAMGKAMSGFGDAGKTDETSAEPDSMEAMDNATDVTEAPSAEEAAEKAKEAAEKAKEEAEKKAKKEQEYREMAIQLAKEAGYKVVEYRGNGIFYVDYAISGVLTHGFVYPYDIDTAMVFPWISVELRGKDMIRVKAPGFAKQDGAAAGGGMAGMGGAASDSKTEGSFTLITDAEVVSQNDEDGSETPGATKTFRWKVTPRTTDAPMATLKVKGL